MIHPGTTPALIKHFLPGDTRNHKARRSLLVPVQSEVSIDKGHINSTKDVLGLGEKDGCEVQALRKVSRRIGEVDIELIFMKMPSARYTATSQQPQFISLTGVSELTFPANLATHHSV